MGALRNYSKYKDFKLLLFIRTPIIYFFLYLIFQTKNIWKILIFERWIMFVYKTFKSIINKDYIKKKEKYIQKYGLKYK
jgi:hypothetical protein